MSGWAASEKPEDKEELWSGDGGNQAPLTSAGDICCDWCYVIRHSAGKVQCGRSFVLFSGVASHSHFNLRENTARLLHHANLFGSTLSSTIVQKGLRIVFCKIADDITQPLLACISCRFKGCNQKARWEVPKPPAGWQASTAPRWLTPLQVSCRGARQWQQEYR